MNMERETGEGKRMIKYSVNNFNLEGVMNISNRSSQGGCRFVLAVMVALMFVTTAGMQTGGASASASTESVPSVQGSGGMDDSLVVRDAAPIDTNPAAFNMAQTISDLAQRTTIAFSGLAMMTGSLESQSFFPPGKVADYTGFQYLRDNDPDNMGHNTSFLTRVANNVIYILNTNQLIQLKTLATNQMAQIDLYGYKRFRLMKAFRRVLEGDIPSGSEGLSLSAVKQASRELYILDGQISFDRALLYANIFRSMDSTQKAYLDAMKGKGWSSWPNVTDEQIRDKMSSLPQGTAVAVMTYASDLFSWYAGSVDADVYFCPERHGTYYGSFYIKDAPAIGHEGYSIDEQLTATAGSALCDSSKGYVTPDQAALMSSLVDMQRTNLYEGASNICQTRTQIAELLRSLRVSTASNSAVKAKVLALSATYGNLDGANNFDYAMVFAEVYNTLTSDQKTKIAALRKSIMSGTYTNGTPFDYSVCSTPFLYSSPITNLSAIAPYVANTDRLFFDVSPLTITRLQATMSFAKLSNDICSVTARFYPASFNPTNHPTVIVEIGGAQVPFTLNSSGRGTNGTSICICTYTRPTAARSGFWTLTATLKKCTWHEAWAAQGIANATIKSPGMPVCLPVRIIAGQEVFASEPALKYTATANMSGIARY